MKTVFALVLGVVAAIAVACGGSAKKSAAPSVMPAPAQHDVGAGDPRAQITAIAEQMNDELSQLSLPPVAEPRAVGSGMVEAASATPPRPSADPTCKPAASDTCKSSCKLSDSICDSAKKICDIAAGMSNDAWATGKCNSGNDSCTSSREKCCACQL